MKDFVLGSSSRSVVFLAAGVTTGLVSMLSASSRLATSGQEPDGAYRAVFFLSYLHDDVKIKGNTNHSGMDCGRQIEMKTQLTKGAYRNLGPTLFSATRQLS